MEIGGGNRWGGRVPSKLDDVEMAAEVSRVSECVELAERGGGLALLGDEPIASVLGEPAPLVAKCEWPPPQTESALGDRGEVHVGGDVHFPGSDQWVIRSAVLAKCPEGSGFPCGVVEFRSGEAVIQPNHQAIREALGEGLKKFVDVSAHLGSVAGGKVGSKQGECGKELGISDLGVGFPGEFLVVTEADTDLAPVVTLPLDHVE